jgi:hypothetical protein
MTDHVLVIAGDWAVGADELQWMLMRRHKRKTGDSWDPVSFVSSTRDILARCMREKGVEDGTASLLLSGLPDTFKPRKAPAPAPRGAVARMWPLFVQVAGPPLTPLQFRFATVSDRDPKTGRSSWEETEARNRARLDGA